MNRGNLRAAVIANTKRNDKNDVINTGLDLGIVEITQRHAMRAVRTEVDVDITTDSTSIALPEDFHQFVEARLINGTISYPIDVRRKTWIVSKYPSVDDYPNGQPCYAYIDINAGTFNFVPKSNGDYTIRMTYIFSPASFEDDTTENPIPGTDNALVEWATHYLYRSLEMFEMATQWRALFEVSLRTFNASDRRTNEQLQRDPFPSVNEFSGPYNPNDPFAKREP